MGVQIVFTQCDFVKPYFWKDRALGLTHELQKYNFLLSPVGFFSFLGFLAFFWVSEKKFWLSGKKFWFLVEKM